MTYAILGIDDSVNSCDCCGKSNLKSTIIVQTEDGEVLHYGSVCATRHTKYTSKDIKNKLSDIEKTRKDAHNARYCKAIAEWRCDMDNVRSQAKIAEAHKLRLIGREFLEFHRELTDIAREKEKQIIRKYNLDVNYL